MDSSYTCFCFVSGTRTETTSASGNRVCDVHHAQAVLLGKGAAAAARSETHDHVNAGVTQVLGMGVALAAVADDGHGLAGKGIERRVVVVVHACGHGGQSSS